MFLCALGGCSLLFDSASPSDAIPSDGSPSVVGDAAGSGWHDLSYAKRLPFTVTNPTDENLVDFPVLLVIAKDDLGQSMLAELDQAKLLLVDGTQIPLELDVAETDRGLRVNFWFSADLSPGEAHSYLLYFGGAEDSRGDATEVWNSYLRVWHLGEEATIPPIPFAESATSLPVNAAERLAGSAVGGVIGGAVAAAGGSDGIAKTIDPLYAMPTECMSITGWVRPDPIPAGSVPGTQSLVNTLSGGADLGYRFRYREGALAGPKAIFSFDVPGDTEVPVSETSPLPPAEWSWLAVNQYMGASSAKAQLYVNGQPVDDAKVLPGIPIFTDALTLNIGTALDGRMDELRISNTCRTDAWMDLQYQAMTEPYLPVFGAVELRP